MSAARLPRLRTLRTSWNRLHVQLLELTGLCRKSTHSDLRQMHASVCLGRPPSNSELDFNVFLMSSLSLRIEMTNRTEDEMAGWHHRLDGHESE